MYRWKIGLVLWDWMKVKQEMVLTSAGWMGTIHSRESWYLNRTKLEMIFFVHQV